jgi:hypothetical protein
LTALIDGFAKLHVAPPLVRLQLLPERLLIAVKCQLLPSKNEICVNGEAVPPKPRYPASPITETLIVSDACFNVLGEGGALFEGLANSPAAVATAAKRIAPAAYRLFISSSPSGG